MPFEPHPPTPGDADETALRRAQALLDAGRAADAVALLLQSPPSDPEAPRYLSLLGQALSEAGRNDEGLGIAERLVAVAPDDPASHALHSLLLVRTGRRRASLAAADRSLALDPTQPTALQLKALLELEVGSEDAALATAQRLRAVEPDEAFAHRVYARVALHVGRWDEVEAAYRKALSLDPADAVALHELGEFLTWAERGDEGVELMRAAATANPEDLRQREAALRAGTGYDPRFWWVPAGLTVVAVAAFSFGWEDRWFRWTMAGLAVFTLLGQLVFWRRERRSPLSQGNRDFLRRATDEQRRLARWDWVLLLYALVVMFLWTFGVDILVSYPQPPDHAPGVNLRPALWGLAAVTALGLPFLPWLWRRVTDKARDTLRTLGLFVPLAIAVFTQYSAWKDDAWRPTVASIPLLVLSVLATLYLAAAFWRGHRA